MAGFFMRAQLSFASLKLQSYTDKNMLRSPKQTTTLQSLEGLVHEMYSAMNTGFTAVETRFQAMEGNLDSEFSELHVRVEKLERGFRTVRTGMDGLIEQSHDTNRRVGNLELRVEDVRETLESLSQAVDTDALSIVEYGQRIARLEQISA
jgi:hypothetical protein